MKKTNLFTTNWVIGALALGAVLLATSARAESVAQVVQVIQVKGDARYATDNKTWHTIHAGDVLQPGVVIQTATHSSVDLQFSDRKAALNAYRNVSNQAGGSASAYAPPSNGLNYTPEEPKANIVRVFESTVLAVDKLLVDRTGADEVAETQLDLRAGHIMGNVKKLSAASKYEIKIPNGVAGIRGSFYSIYASGLLKMASGSSILAIVGADGAVKTWLVNAGFGFDPSQNQIFKITGHDETNPPPSDFHPITYPNNPPQSPPYCPPPYSPVR